MGVTHICQDALLLSERKDDGNEENAYFLECGGMLLRRCLGFHPVQKRPPFLLSVLTSILDGKRRLRSCLTCLVLSEPMTFNAVKIEHTFAYVRSRALPSSVRSGSAAMREMCSTSLSHSSGRGAFGMGQ